MTEIIFMLTPRGSMTDSIILTSRSTMTDSIIVVYVEVLWLIVLY